MGSNQDVVIVNIDQGPSKAGSVEAEQQPLIMQIIVRKDLLESWGIGPLMTQVSHATAAVLHETRERPETAEYLADLKHMHTVVLQIPSADAIRALSASLSVPLPPHHLWIEQPEDEPSCLALAPNRRGDKVLRKVLDKAGCRVWK